MAKSMKMDAEDPLLNMINVILVENVLLGDFGQNGQNVGLLVVPVKSLGQENVLMENQETKVVLVKQMRSKLVSLTDVIVLLGVHGDSFRSVLPLAQMESITDQDSV